MSRWKQILVIICGLLALSVLLAACGGASDGGSNYPERSRPTAAPLAPAATAAPLAPPPLAPSSRTESSPPDRRVKGVDKTYQWGGAKVYHQRGHWPA